MGCHSDIAGELKRIAKYVVLLSFYFSFQNVYNQIEKSGEPFTYSLKSFKNAPVYEVDITGIENAVSDSDHFKILKVATHIETDIKSNLHGRWINYNGYNVWQITLHASGAKSIGVFFGNYHLPKGANLFVFNDTEIKGAFTEKNNKLYGSLMVAPVPGEYVEIELQLPQDIEMTSDLTINAIKYGFVDISEILANNSLNSEICNVDILCNTDPEILKLKNAVVRILGNGEDLCTGTIINNTSNDKKLYVITANHCIASHAAANNTIFYFNHESPYCNGPYISSEKTISGCKLIATKQSLDFSLVELLEDPPYHYNPYIAGWNLNTTTINHTFIIHHPSGDVKKYSVDNESPVVTDYPYSDSFDPNSFLWIKKWDVGTTEGGSSGGPLFDNNYKLVGTLTGGKANCLESVNDYFSLFAKDWNQYPDSNNQTKYWLDPLNTNKTSMEGLDPFAEFKLRNVTADNIEPGENFIYDKADTWGYISGHNFQKFDQYAEKFHMDDSVSLLGFYVNVAKAQLVSSFGKVRFQVWKNNLNDTSIIYSKYYPIDYFKEKNYSYIELENFYPLYGDFYIGYKLFYLTEQDTFAVYHTFPRSTMSANTALAYKYDIGWISLYKVINQSFSASLDIKPVVNNPDLVISVKPAIEQDNKVLIYPNPAHDVINVIFSDFNPTIYTIFDINGISIITQKIESKNNKLELDVRQLANGLYLIKIMCDNEFKFYKFIVSHEF